MRIYVAFAVFVASFVFTSQVSAEDNELFSEVAMETVYLQKQDSAEEDSRDEIDLPKRMTGATTLHKLLIDAGYEPKQNDGGVVSIELRHGEWKLPVRIKAEVGNDRLVMEMPLARIEDESKLDHAKLLKLLSVADLEDRVRFSYRQADRLIGLRRVMDNRGFTPKRIKQELSELVKIAATHQDAWSGLGQTTKVEPSKAEAAPTAQPTTTGQLKTAAPTLKNAPAAAKLTLVGTWSASIGPGEAFALEIKRDSTFQLVHVKAGKSVSSAGKASKTSNQITLSGNDGTKIVGTVTQSSPDAFALAVSGTTLNFKKAK